MLKEDAVVAIAPNGICQRRLYGIGGRSCQLERSLVYTLLWSDFISLVSACRTGVSVYCQEHGTANCCSGLSIRGIP